MPEPILKGRFNLYETPEGGYVVAYLPDGDKEPKHLEIPPAVRAVWEGKLNPLRAIKDLMSGASI